MEGNITSNLTNITSPELPGGWFYMLLGTGCWIALFNGLSAFVLYNVGFVTKNTYDLQIFSLCITDISVGLFMLSFILTLTFLPKYFVTFEICAVVQGLFVVPQGSALCQVFGICFHRLRVIRNPHVSSSPMVRREVVSQLILAWVVSFVVMTWPYILFRRPGDVLEKCTLEEVFEDRFWILCINIGALDIFILLSTDVLYYLIIKSFTSSQSEMNAVINSPTLTIQECQGAIQAIPWSKERPQHSTQHVATNELSKNLKARERRHYVRSASHIYLTQLDDIIHQPTTLNRRWSYSGIDLHLSKPTEAVIRLMQKEVKNYKRQSISFSVTEIKKQIQDEHLSSEGIIHFQGVFSRPKKVEFVQTTSECSQVSWSDDKWLNVPHIARPFTQVSDELRTTVGLQHDYGQLAGKRGTELMPQQPERTEPEIGRVYLQNGGKILQQQTEEKCAAEIKETLNQELGVFIAESATDNVAKDLKMAQLYIKHGAAASTAYPGDQSTQVDIHLGSQNFSTKNVTGSLQCRRSGGDGDDEDEDGVDDYGIVEVEGDITSQSRHNSLNTDGTSPSLKDEQCTNLYSYVDAYTNTGLKTENVSQTARKSTREVTEISRDPSVMSDANSRERGVTRHTSNIKLSPQSLTQRKQTRSKSQRIKRKMVRTIGILLFVFNVCMAPFCIISFIIALSRQPGDLLYEIAFLCRLLNSVFNPIIYIYQAGKFKPKIHSFLRCGKATSA